MVTVREVKTKKDRKEFINFPLRLYKGVYSFVPPMYSDEKKLLKSGGNTPEADAIFFLAERDGRTVGRIQGIIQKQYNEIHDTKRVRFTRFDSIDDTEVSDALFAAVEDWARGCGMTELCGPLGYSDFDREGLLIEGFEENNTFEEQYNYEYYAALCEHAGLQKEIDWLEFELTAPKVKNEMLAKLAQRSLEINKLHLANTEGISNSEYVRKYMDGAFACVDECYAKLYGTVPITEKLRGEIVEQFGLIIRKDYFICICDENEKVVAFGLGCPSIGDALKKSGGRLTPSAIIKLLKILKNPRSFDLALIAVLPEYQNSALNAVLINEMVERLCNGTVDKLETNLNLETNTAVMAQWKHFTARQHKRRRAYLKSI